MKALKIRTKVKSKTTSTMFKYIVSTAFMVIAIDHTTAQTKEEGQGGQIEIFSESNRRVEKATKLPDKPQYRDSVVNTQAMKYNAISARANTTILPENIKPANVVPKELLDKLYKFYVKGGVGNYTNILGEAYYNQERNATSDFGVHAKHFSSLGGINDVAKDAFSNNQFEVYGSKLWPNYTGNINVLYNREAFHFYGFNPDSFALENKQIKQIYNTLGFKLSGATTYLNDSNKINHNESLTYRPYFDNHGAYDHNFLLDLNGGKKLKTEYYGLGFMADFNQLNDDSCNCLTLMKEPPTYRCLQQQTNMILGLNPSVTTLTGKLKLKIGLIAQADIYEEGKFYFFPDVELSYSLFNDIFIPFIGANRSIIRNSMYTLSKQNPFLLTNQEYINTNQRIHVYGGIKGTWSANLSFNASLSYSQNYNMALFVQDTSFSVGNRFRIAYDSVDVLKADAHILFRTTSKWHILFGGTYFNYTTAHEDFAWNLPMYKVYSTFQYNLKDKIIAKCNLELLGSRRTYSLEPMAGVSPQADGKYVYDLKPFLDTDIQIEYRYTKRFSIFAHFNNLAGRYYRWTNYPYQGFNALGGVTYMF